MEREPDGIEGERPREALSLTEAIEALTSAVDRARAEGDGLSEAAIATITQAVRNMQRTPVPGEVAVVIETSAGRRRMRMLTLGEVIDLSRAWYEVDQASALDGDAQARARIVDGQTPAYLHACAAIVARAIAVLKVASEDRETEPPLESLSAYAVPIVQAAHVCLGFVPDPTSRVIEARPTGRSRSA